MQTQVCGEEENFLSEHEVLGLCWVWGVWFKEGDFQVLFAVLEANNKMFPQCHLTRNIILCKISSLNG